MDENIHFVIAGKTPEGYFFAANAGSLQDCIIQLSQEPRLENYEFTEAENWQELNRALKYQDVEVSISAQIVFDEDDSYVEEIFDKLYQTVKLLYHLRGKYTSELF